MFLMLEAINENRADCFGWALEEVLEERGMIRLKADDGCTHHHHNTGNLVGRGKDHDVLDMGYALICYRQDNTRWSTRVQGSPTSS